MTLRYLVGGIALCALVIPAALAAAPSGVPSAANSTIPAFLVSSPVGVFVSNVIVRDFASNPIPNSTVTLDFSDCSELRPCANPCTDCSAVAGGKSISKLTNASGAASFDLRVGGSGCPDPPVVRIYADGVPLGTLNFAALDITGDLAVTSGDLAVLRYVLIPAQDLNGDFDGNHIVDEYDEGIALANLGASCNGPTSMQRHTWGQIKTTYR